MENEEDEAPAASNALPNSSPVPSPPQLEDDSAPATAATASPDRDVGEVEIGVSESAQPRVGDGEDEGCVGAVRESEAEAARTADGEGVADVISGEEGRTAEEVEVREDMEWAEIAREERDATGEEEEEAVEENREVEGIEKDAATEVEDFVGDAEATPNAGGDAEVIEAEEDAEVDGVSLHIADDVVVDDAVEDTEAGVYAGEDTVVVADAGEDIEVEDTEVVDAEEDTEVVDAEEDTEVAELGADTEVVDAEEDTEVADAGQDAEGDTEVADAEEDTEVADAYEDAEVGDDNAGDTEVVDAADYTGLAEVGDTADEMAEEADEAEEETEVADGADEAEEETEVADGADEADEETEVADAAEEADAAVETEVEEATKSGGKRKRGRITKAAAKSPSKKKGEEDVCFICFDGGELVLCDRRGCPKAYHPACVNRDEAFFRTKGRWNCGWHLCSNCEKNANYMCYTCTFSLCKGCIKDAVILCVRGSKGFCEACMKTVMMIEQKEQENPAQVNFDDKSSWEYLFKDYWTDLKERLGLTSDEIAMAKNPWKGSHVHAGKQESPDELYDANDDGGSGSDFGTAEASLPKKRKPKKRLRSRAKAVDSPSKATAVSTGRVKDDGLEWASNALLEFVMHMRDGDKSKLSPFEVQDLLLVYIKRNKLRDPRKKSQTICDQRLLNLFGKKVVGHFEMLKLLESHFYVKEDFQGDDVQGSVVDTKAQLETDGSADAIVKAGKDRKRRRKNERVPQSNLDDYAAIDIHNISLIYLKRNLLEDLIEDTDNFHDKVVGTFVRVRISGSVKNQDMYRLVQVVGTSEAAEPYKVGKRMTHTLLEILNLDKTEVVSIDTISNHEFSEDECKRLRQSIKCGLINRLTVGDIQEKAMALQEVRVKDWLEAEVLRLSHLRDRASDLGKRKQLRECVEKLQLLKSPEERQRRLEEIPEIHVDPNMDPNYESEEADIEEDEKKQESYLTPRGSAFVKRGREPISPRMGGSASSDSWSGTRNYSSTNREFSRSMSNKGYFNKGDDAGSRGEIVNENAWNQGRHMETPPNSHEKPKTASMGEAASRNIQSVAMPDSFSGSVPDISPASLSASVTQSTDQVSETEKMWHYRDPSGKVQGPFSMVQLRKWNKSGYFPTELKIWRASGNQDDSILLTDALAGKIQKEQPIPDNSYQKIQTVQSPHISSYSGKPYGNEGQGGERSHLDQSRASWKPHGSLASSGQSAGESWRPEPETTSLKVITAPSVEVPKYSTGAWGSDYNRSDLPNLPSPTPTQSAPGGTKSQAYESKWSPTSFPAQSAGSALVANQLPGGNGLRESAPAASVKMPVVDGSNVFHGAFSQHTSVPGNKVQNVMEYLGGVSTNFGGQSMRSSENDMNSRQMHPQPVVPSESHRLQVNTNLHQAPNSSDASISSGAHGWVSGLAAKPEAIPSGPVPGSERQAWGSAPSQKLEPNNTIPNSAQAPSYGHYGDAPSTIHASASSFNTGNQTGGFPAGGFSGLPQSSDPWRPPVSGHQPNNQPSVPAPQLNNQPTGPWVGPMPGNPNMGWMGQAPGNLNWGVSGQAPTFANPNPGRAAPSQVPAPGNTNPGWAAPGQGPPPPVNPNPGWVAPPAQGTLPGNPNPGWAPPTGNPGMWGGEQSQNGDRFSGQRSSHGGDSGYGSNNNKPWNRQSSFGGGGGGGSSRPRVCKFHENGHCKKGSSCNYLHT